MNVLAVEKTGDVFRNYMIDMNQPTKEAKIKAKRRSDVRPHVQVGGRYSSILCCDFGANKNVRYVSATVWIQYFQLQKNM